jgi:glycosyltransferase involved in cell wall biosynthesis
MYAIIGDGDERSRLEKLIIELGLERNVFLLGHVDNAAQYLKAFDIFVLASLSEGLGYVILEAGLVGIPCIATNVGGIPEIIENMVSGILVQPRQPEEITKAINYFVGNKNIREKCAMALQKKVSTEFTIRGMVQATVVTYQ